MREIKFRGKRTDNGEWVYGYYYYNSLMKRAEVVSFDDVRSYVYTVIPETVGQYTGLKDKNGAEIYEGDILTVTNPDDEEDKLCIVEYDCCCGGYVYEPHSGYGDYDLSTIGWAMTMEYKFEVIGNIHENVNLLTNESGGK